MVDDNNENENGNENERQAEEYFNSGLEKARAGDHEGALADFDKVIELSPNNAAVYNNRGLVKDNLKDFQGALADFDKAIELNPNDAKAYNNRGLVKSNLKDFKAALADFDKAIELDPDNQKAINNQKVILLQKEQVKYIERHRADDLKQVAARRALELVKNGMRLGLGTGSTAHHFIDGLGAKVAAGLNVLCVATSEASRAQAASLNIPLAELDEVQRLDLTIDGADELDHKLHLIKGGGGALLREKIVAAASATMLVIADESKLVDRLGAFPLPIEVTQFAHTATSQKIAAAISKVQGKDAPPPAPILRGGNMPFITDNGNYIYDYPLQQINDPPALAAALQTIPGVVAHGLFINLATGAIIAGENGLTEIGEV